MKFRSLAQVWPAVLAIGAVATVQAALIAGGTAYTKRIETKLLAEPKPLAGAVGKVGFAKKLKIEEASGPWLRVSDGATTGWVFGGNVSETKPAEGTGADSHGLSASTTSATAAARPLTPAANDYAVRRNLGNARQDLDWLNAQCKTLTSAELENFLQAQKKGEYQ
jgi:hypothetical protein